jgi:hypothetical protein
MTILYGDSTLFPYEDDFIEVSKDLIDCCVALFAAQHTIASALARERERELHRKTESNRLEALVETIQRAIATATGERGPKISGQVFGAAKAVIDHEIADLKSQTTQEIAASRASSEQAKQQAYLALETFQLRHKLPASFSELRLSASEKGYTAKTWVATPFGIEALFSVLIPPQSEWNKPRRVGEIIPSVEVQMPLSAGWISKRIELQPVRLDKFFVSELSLSEEKTTISLRKNAASGTGYLLEIFSEMPPKVTIATLGEDGLPTETARNLVGDDYTHILRFWTKLAASVQGIDRRQSMLSATVNKKPLQENDLPEAIGMRLIQILTPILNEIDRRSLAPGELILRRDLSGGRREEMYATKAELYEKTKGLPESFQLLFAPLELSIAIKTPPTDAGLLQVENSLKQQPQGPIPSGLVTNTAAPTVSRAPQRQISPGQTTITSSLSGQISIPPTSPGQAAITASPSGQISIPPPISPGQTTITASPSGQISIPPVPPGQAAITASPSGQISVPPPIPTRKTLTATPAVKPPPLPTRNTTNSLPAEKLSLPASLKSLPSLAPSAQQPSYLTQESLDQPFGEDELSEFFDEESIKRK